MYCDHMEERIIVEMSQEEEYAIDAIEKAVAVLRRHNWWESEFNVTESITRGRGKALVHTSRSLILRMSFSQYASPGKNDP